MSGLKREAVEVPGYGLAHVRELSALRGILWAEAAGAAADTAEERLLRAARFVVLCLCDAEGKPLLEGTAADARALADEHAIDVIVRLQAAALQVNQATTQEGAEAVAGE